MKSASFKNVFFVFLLASLALTATAQDDDGIYGDIYQTPPIEEIEEDTVSPLDGYSTVDDYYPEGGYNSNGTSDQSYSESYTDQNGNVTNNYYYGDYYEDNDYAYASRIRRFHNYNNGWGYYDPYYTNMYYYNYDPYYWGTSIYVGYWPSYNWYWSSGWGWGWNYGWGSPYYYRPACYGGWGWNYGWGGSYWSGYNNGYWNGYYDVMAYGGYYNTYDSYSGIYNGHRGSSGTGGTVGSGYRGSSVVTAYNQAAKEGKVHHANKGNVLGTADGAAVNGNLDGYQIRTAQKEAVTSKEVSSDRLRTDVTKERSNTTTQTVERTNPYQRTATDRASTSSERQRATVGTTERSRVTTMPSRDRSQSATSKGNTYYRGNPSTRIDNRQPSRSATPDRGNMYRDIQRSNPSNNGINRNSNDDYYRPQQSRPNGNQYERPSNDQRNNVPSRNYQTPSRNNQTPSRNYEAPSRNSNTPSRNYEAPSRNNNPSRSVTPNRGSSGGNYSTPNRSSGSYNSGGSRGSSSSPSRGSSGSRGGRP